MSWAGTSPNCALVDAALMRLATLSRMDNTDRIRELLREIRDAEQWLDGLRAELARLVAEELGWAPAGH